MTLRSLVLLLPCVALLPLLPLLPCCLVALRCLCSPSSSCALFSNGVHNHAIKSMPKAKRLESTLSNYGCRALAAADTQCSGWATRVWHAATCETKWIKLNSSSGTQTRCQLHGSGSRNEAPNALVCAACELCSLCVTLFISQGSLVLLSLQSSTACTQLALTHSRTCAASNHIHAGS